MRLIRDVLILIMLALFISPFVCDRSVTKVINHGKEIKVGSIRILTINIWGIFWEKVGRETKSERLRIFCSEIKKLDPDIIVMQEVWFRKDYKYLVRNLGYPFYSDYDIKYIGKYSGLVLFSKIPFYHIERINFGWGIMNLTNPVKAAMKVKFKIRGKTLTVYNMHLTAINDLKASSYFNKFGKRMFEPDSLEATRWKQLKKVTNFIEDSCMEGTVVMCGDLNTGPRYPLWWYWKKYLADKKSSLYKTMSYTMGVGSTYNNMYGGVLPDEGQLDHIVGFGGASIITTKVVLNDLHIMLVKKKRFLGNISDHYGLMSIVDIN